MGFDSCNHYLKIRDSIGTSTPKMGISLGSVEVHSFTFSHTLESIKCDSQTSLLVHTFASLGLGRKPKIRVTTLKMALVPYGGLGEVFDTLNL
jgi:hypothetical protein